MTTTENKILFLSFLYNVPYTEEEALIETIDFNFLMQVVEKIENLTDKESRVIYDFTIYSDAVIIQDQLENPLFIVNKSEEIGSLQKESILFETKIEAVYNACVEFIKWWNENKG